MQIPRKRLIAAAALTLVAAAGTAVYWQQKKIAGWLASGLDARVSKTLGRQLRTGEISFSILGGITVTDACLSRKPDFTKGEFFCAKKAVIVPDLLAFARNKVYFSRVYLEKPRLKVREKNGAWDFEDLLALLPDTDKGLYLTWNTRELEMSGALLEADLETSGLSLALENASVKLDHHSTFGGNYGLEAAGLVKTVLKGKLLTTELDVKAETNFAYGGPSSSEGAIKAANTSYGAMTLRDLRLSWALFNLRKPLAEKNYSVDLTAQGLLVPGRESPVRDAVAGALDMFAAAMGRAAPKIEDIEASSLKASFRLDDNKVAVKDIALRANFIDLDAGLEIDGPAKTAEAGLEAAIGASRIKMAASGPMAEPAIRPALSVTLSKKFRDSLLAMEKGLLKSFPVTGE